MEADTAGYLYMNKCLLSGKKIAILLMIVSGVGFFLSCSSGPRGGRTGTATPPPPEMPGVDESFDPFVLQDDDLEFPEPPMPKADFSRPGTSSTSPETPAPPAQQVLDGFRIQLFASRDIETATLQKKEAEYEFASDSVGVYIEFDSPLYKVRIGDCQTREDAERLLKVARARGFPTAFIVKSKVYSMPLLPQDSSNTEPDR